MYSYIKTSRVLSNCLVFQNKCFSILIVIRYKRTSRVTPSDENAEEGQNQNNANSSHITRDPDRHSERHIEQPINEEPPPKYITSSAPPELLSPIQVSIGPANVEPESRRTMYNNFPPEVIGTGQRQQSSLTPLDGEDGFIGEGTTVPPRVDSAHRVPSSLREAAQCSTCGGSSTSKSNKGPSGSSSRISSGISNASQKELLDHQDIAKSDLNKSNKELEQPQGSSQAQNTRIHVENGELKAVTPSNAAESFGKQIENNIEVIDGPRGTIKFTGQIEEKSLESKRINLTSNEVDGAKRDSAC